jgi:hypothetical protein
MCEKYRDIRKIKGGGEVEWTERELESRARREYVCICRVVYMYRIKGDRGRE